MIENQIIQYIEENILITSQNKDYIIISEMVIQIKTNINIEITDEELKSEILKYLKSKVNIVPYTSIVVAGGKKRGYPGIKWKTEETIIKPQHYLLSNYYDYKELLNNEIKRLKFLDYIENNMSLINWPPINMNFYMSVLISHNTQKIEKMKEELKNEIKIIIKNEILEELGEIILNKIIEKFRKPNILKSNKSEINKEIFEEYLNDYIDYDINKKEIIYNIEIIELFYKTLGNKEISSNSLYKILKQYILKKYCNNNIEELLSIRSKSKTKPMYYKGIYIKIPCNKLIT